MYHISKNGVPKKCTREPDNCNLGGPEEHFSTQEEAQRYANELMSEKFSIIPDVKNISAEVPTEEVLNTMNYKYSELYSSVMYINNKSHKPILCLGINDKGNKMYQFFNFNDNVYYDINGVIASSIDGLEDYFASKYNITDNFKIVEYPNSLRMIKILTDIDIDSYSSILKVEKHLENMISQSDSSDRDSLNYIYKEIVQ